MRSTPPRSTMEGATTARPALRADYGLGYYAAFVIDPDGFRIEAHCDQPGS